MRRVNWEKQRLSPLRVRSGNGLFAQGGRAIVLLAISLCGVVGNGHAATLRTDRIQETCHTVADLAWTFANDHQNGVPLDEEEQRYSRQTRSPKVIEATYHLSEYMTPVQVQVSTFRQCIVQLRHTVPSDGNDGS